MSETAPGGGGGGGGVLLRVGSSVRQKAKGASVGAGKISAVLRRVKYQVGSRETAR